MSWPLTPPCTAMYKRWRGRWMSGIKCRPRHIHQPKRRLRTTCRYKIFQMTFILEVQYEIIYARFYLAPNHPRTARLKQKNRWVAFLHLAERSSRCFRQTCSICLAIRCGVDGEVVQWVLFKVAIPTITPYNRCFGPPSSTTGSSGTTRVSRFCSRVFLQRLVDMQYLLCIPSFRTRSISWYLRRTQWNAALIHWYLSTSR